MSLACHHCVPSSIPGVGMWYGSGCLSSVGDFLQFTGFVHHIIPQNTNIHAFENELPICSMTLSLAKITKANTVIIKLLRPPKIKTFYLLKTLFAKFKLFFSSFSTPSVPLIRDHLWDCPKVVFKTTFGTVPKVVLM